MIVIDQLRGDLPFRYRDRFGKGGFRYLLDRGLWYGATFHPHAHTETAVGHTTLATGAYPSRHGVIGDSWINYSDGQTRDSVEDPLTTLVGPTAPAAPGSSPNCLQSTTFADELVLANNGGSKAFGVSTKDRAAILLAGRAGKAFWFPTEGAMAGNFVSSSYYYKTLPTWASDWNSQQLPNSYSGKEWSLLHDPATYLFAKAPSFNQAIGVLPYGIKFPHQYGSDSDPMNPYYVALTAGPLGDELTLGFVKTLLEKEQLGRRGVTDFLGVSFSANDFVGHLFTTSSMEAEDILLRLDQTLAKLFATIKNAPGLGLENTLIILTGDHGAPEFPAYLKLLNIDLHQGGNTTGTILEKDLLSAVTAALNTAYAGKGLQGKDLLLGQGFDTPYFYLNRPVIEKAGLQLADVERTIATAAMTVDGVAAAVGAHTPESAVEIDAELLAQIRRNYNPRTSGDVYVVQLPDWQIASAPASGEMSIVNHGSPWTYDTFVPLVFAGGRITPSFVVRKVSTIDVAPTLSMLFKTKFPSACTGTPLPEVLAPYFNSK